MKISSTFSRLFITAVGLLTYITIDAQQLRMWSLPQDLISFGPSGPSGKIQLPGNTLPLLSVSNSIYDKNGSLLFFIIDSEIYNHNGIILDNFQINGTFIQTDRLGQEMSIVPVPGSCFRYYIIGSYLNTIGNAWLPFYAVLDMSVLNYQSSSVYGQLDYLNSTTNVFSLTPATLPNAFDDPANGNSERNRFGLAVSPFRPTTYDHFLFMKGFSDTNLYRYRITSTGIIFDSANPIDGGVVTLGPDPSLQDGDNKTYPEMELVLANGVYQIANVYDGRRMVISDLSTIDGTFIPGTVRSATLPNWGPNTDYQIKGLEFSPNGNYLYYSYIKLQTSGGASEHIGFVDLSNLITTEMPFPNYQWANTLGQSFIEIGYDGRLHYFDTGNLISLDNPNNGPPVVPSGTDWSITFTNIFGTLSILPDQIDGQDYDQIIEACDNCVCALTEMVLSHNGTDHPLSCLPHGVFTPALSCPISQVNISGFFGCNASGTGELCQTGTDVVWTLTGPNSTVPIDGGTTSNYSLFFFPPSYFQTNGTYFLTLSTLCPGQQDSCVCVLDWIVECDSCCTDSLSFIAAAQNVQTFGTIGDCELSFAASGLTTCMQITYDWGDPLNSTTGPISNNNVPVSFTYPGPGTYYVCYQIDEMDNGDTCWSYTHCDSILVLCDPVNNSFLQCGVAVATCFSGTIITPQGTTMDLISPVIALFDVRNPSGLSPGPGDNWAAPKIMFPEGNADKCGQVFGLAIDQSGSIFTTASTIYGDATNIPGFAWGPGGPGAIYRFTYDAGQWVRQVYIDIPNFGSGLGNITYDKNNDQFFVTNHLDGGIYRIPNVAYPGIPSPFNYDFWFHSEPATYPASHPDFCDLGTRLWGIGYHSGENRVYYARWNEDLATGRQSAAIQNEIRSIGLLPSGGFNLSSDVHEIWISDYSQQLPNPPPPPPFSSPVSDIEFAENGDMIVAEKTMLADIGFATNPSPGGWAHKARILKYTGSTTNWSQSQQLHIGNTEIVAGSYNNSAGGVDYGYSGLDVNKMVTGCDKMIWGSGDALMFPGSNDFNSSNNVVYGIAGMPATGNSNIHWNISPPWTESSSFYVDLDGNLVSVEKLQIGDVDIFRNAMICPCPNCFCKDPGFTDLIFHSGPLSGQPIECETSYENLPCPPQAFGYFLTGKFECEGDSCEKNPYVFWELSGPTGTHSDSVLASPYFVINLLPSHTSIDGTYTMSLTSICGTDTCKCEFQFGVDCDPSCPCDPDAIKEIYTAVSQGFAVSSGNSSCQVCFTPIALTDCEKVDWYLNNSSGQLLGSSTGNQTFCYTFPNPGTYTIAMVVTRLKPDGTPCETFEKIQTINVTCVFNPTCIDPVIKNYTFSDGAVPGGMGSGGSSEGWTSIVKELEVIEGQAGSEDNWTIKLHGNLDTAGVLTSIDPICLARDTGVITLRVMTDPIPGIPGSLDPPVGRGKPRQLAIQVYQGNTFEVRKCGDSTCIQLAMITMEEFVPGEWYDITIPYDFRDWHPNDSCGAGLLIRPAIYVTNDINTVQGGEETYSYAQIDNFCINGTLVSTDNPRFHDKYRLFPNPNAGSFTLELPQLATPDMSIRIIGLTGQIHWDQRIEVGTKMHTIHASELPSGMYFVQVWSEGRIVAVEKFVRM